MVSDAEALEIDVDYDMNATQVFTAVASALIRKENTLHVLAKCRMPKSIESLPSWVPDWSYTSKVPIWYHDSKLYSAGGPKLLSSHEISNQQLTISGSVFDEISELGPFWLEHQLTDDLADLGTKLLEI